MVTPRPPKDKACLYAYVDKQVVEGLRKLVLTKYGSLRGCLSWEVEQALKAWLAEHRIAERAHSGPKILNQKSTKHPRYKQVAESL
jgi:hypothetical protein